MCQPVFARAFYLTFHPEGPGNEVGSTVTLTTVQDFNITVSVSVRDLDLVQLVDGGRIVSYVVVRVICMCIVSTCIRGGKKCNAQTTRLSPQGFEFDTQ